MTDWPLKNWEREWAIGDRGIELEGRGLTKSEIYRVVRNEFGVGPKTTDNYMRICREYPPEEQERHENVLFTVHLELAYLPRELRAESLQIAEDKGLSAKQARSIQQLFNGRKRILSVENGILDVKEALKKIERIAVDGKQTRAQQHAINTALNRVGSVGPVAMPSEAEAVLVPFGAAANRRRRTDAHIAPTPGQRAALTSKRRMAALKAAQTRKRMSAFAKARAAEAASKEALRVYCKENGWRLAFFEGETGAPRTGIIDAVAFGLARNNPDLLSVRLIQLKGGRAGVTGREIARLKQAAAQATTGWLIAEFDGERLHLLPDDPIFSRSGSGG